MLFNVKQRSKFPPARPLKKGHWQKGWICRFEIYIRLNLELRVPKQAPLKTYLYNPDSNWALLVKMQHRRIAPIPRLKFRWPHVRVERSTSNSWSCLPIPELYNWTMPTVRFCGPLQRYVLTTSGRKVTQLRISYSVGGFSVWQSAWYLTHLS